MQSKLIEELEFVGRRMRSAAQMTVLSVIWLLFFVVAIALSTGTPLFGMTPGVLALVFLGIALFSSVIVCVVSRSWFRDPKWIAQRVESYYPELDSRLLTSLDQVGDESPQDVGFLQHLLLMQTVSHSARNRWELVVTPAKVVFSQLSAVLGFILLLLGSIMIANTTPSRSGDGLPFQEIVDQVRSQDDSPVELDSVEPGNTEVEKGTALTVLAKFKGSLPEKAELVYELVPSQDAVPASETGAEGFLRVPMSPSFDDPVFAGQIVDVTKPFSYWVEYDGQESDRFYATVFEYPEVQQLDFELDFPEYTGLENKTINDARRITALKGTQVRVTARLNKNVASCRLVGEDGEEIPLQENATGEPIYTADLTVVRTTKYRLMLRDQSQRENKLPPQVRINALDNKPPVIKIVKPARDMEVSPLEELMIAARTSDDFGIVRAGISYRVAGKPVEEIVLGEQLTAKKKHVIEHLLAFEELNVEPKQMVNYFFWAEDYVADGKTRRVLSDLYFADVRKFEQVFRQGDPNQNQNQQQNQQQGGQQQQGQQLGELKDLQKQIINATWKLIRRELDPEPSPEFDQDVGVIQDSQKSASNLVDQAVQQAGGQEAAALGAQLKTMMNDVILTLQSARNEDSAAPLTDAVAEEQIIYQLILRLDPDENEVQQQRQRNQSPGQQNRSQQQLEQLQLENDRNRYEQENQAQEQKEQEQSEVRQAINRLKELARRQDDINKQLEKLQTALEEAKSEEEKKEIERRLKRLREQQEELLRDLDELKEQVEQNQDNELMQKAEKELEKTRENLRKSAEALEENQVSQAAAAGNRAKKELEDLRDEFQKQNANQFADDMRDMSGKANDLKSKQDEIAQKLQQMDEDKQKSLRESDDRKQIAEDLAKQQQDYDSIIEDIKDMVRKAEDSEPLLSQELYDTFRDTTNSQTRESIRDTENLLSRGFVTEARKIEAEANQGIEDLNRRIQQAADRIVGDETDSLRRAEQTLRQLSDQINNEIAQNGEPRKPSDSQAEPNQDLKKGESSKNPQTGDRSSPAKQDGSRQATKPGEAKGSGGKQSQKDGQPQKGGDSKGKKEGSKTSKETGKSPSPDPGTAGKKQKGPSKEGSSGQNGKGEKQGKQGGGSSKGNNSPEQDPQQGRQPGKMNSKSASEKQGSSKGSSSSGGSPSGRQPASNTNRQSSRDPMQGFEQLFGPSNSSNGGTARPISGDEYREFSNQLRNIEELLEDPKLRARAAGIREKAKEIRVEMKRHSKKPNWDIVQEFVAEPLESLRAEVARQLLLKENKDALVPIDRDPVPAVFEEQVQEYYRELSKVNQ